MPGPEATTRGREDGFVLVAALWFVALLAVVAVIIGGWLVRTLSHMAALQDRVAARSEILSAESEIAYRMATGYWSPRGLELGDGEALAGQPFPDTLGFALRAGTPYIALDDQPYRRGGLVLRLQDDQGLFRLNSPDHIRLPALLREYGVPFDDRDVLIDRLLDYTQKSELIRLHGANAEMYLRAGRPPPRDSPLLTPWEPRRVLGWDEYPSLWQGPQPLPAIATVRDIAGLNPNTAPAAVLRTLPGIGEDAVARILDYRRTRLILDDPGFELAAGGAAAVDPLALFFFPASSLRLTVMARDDPLVHVIAIGLDFGATPYRIDWAVARPRNAADRDLLARSDLPLLP